jgi:hypothetical protein
VSKFASILGEHVFEITVVVLSAVTPPLPSSLLKFAGSRPSVHPKKSRTAGPSAGALETGPMLVDMCHEGNDMEHCIQSTGACTVGVVPSWWR